MTTDPANWHQVLACVTGALVRGEQRITTHELLAVHLGVPVTDQNGRRLRRVMHDLGWQGPRRMRWGSPLGARDVPASIVKQVNYEIADENFYSFYSNTGWHVSDWR